VRPCPPWPGETRAKPSGSRGSAYTIEDGEGEEKGLALSFAPPLLLPPARPGGGRRGLPLRALLSACRFGRWSPGLAVGRINTLCDLAFPLDDDVTLATECASA